MSLPSCCEYHADQLPPDGSCQQGRLCPCRDKPLYAPLRHRTEDEPALAVQFVGSEPDDTLYEPWGPEVYIAASIGALAVVCLAAALGWLLYQLWPTLSVALFR